jgi:hypothetical protein
MQACIKTKTLKKKKKDSLPWNPGGGGPIPGGCGKGGAPGGPIAPGGGGGRLPAPGGGGKGGRP